MGEGDLFHIEHFTDGRKCPIDVTLFNDQRRCKANNVLMSFFRQDSFVLQGFANRRAPPADGFNSTPINKPLRAPL